MSGCINTYTRKKDITKIWLNSKGWKYTHTKEIKTMSLQFGGSKKMHVDIYNYSSVMQENDKPAPVIESIVQSK